MNFEYFSPENMSSLISTYAIPWSMNITFALLIFFIGKFIVKLISSVVAKILIKAKVDEILVEFVTGIIHSILLLFVVIAALDRLGVETTSLIALIGAAGLAVGLALQGSLQNFASGVMLIVFRPFTTGHFVEVAGINGVVEKITIFSTILRTTDNREVTVPNGSIYGSVITNFSARDTRRVDMVFGIGYGDDMKKAKQLIADVLAADERVLKDPEPVIAIAELADSSVNIAVRPWVKTDDYWPFLFDMNEKVKECFDANDISIPYPQMDVHHQAMIAANAANAA